MPPQHLLKFALAEAEEISVYKWKDKCLVSIQRAREGLDQCLFRTNCHLRYMGSISTVFHYRVSKVVILRTTHTVVQLMISTTCRNNNLLLLLYIVLNVLTEIWWRYFIYLSSHAFLSLTFFIILIIYLPFSILQVYLFIKFILLLLMFFSNHLFRFIL